MHKRIVVLGSIVAALALGGLILFFSQQNTSSSQINKQEAKVQNLPSVTLKTYADPSGFTFNYPDNLSLKKNETTDSNTYADIQLTAKGVNGSINVKIADSKFATLSQWTAANKKASQS